MTKEKKIILGPRHLFFFFLRKKKGIEARNVQTYRELLYKSLFELN